MRVVHLQLSLALLIAPGVLVAQAQAATISPGMTRAQVVAALGEPVTTRTANGHTYLFYKNSCGKACGMNDLVTLQGDSVVDAIFRAPERHYTGTSSSPAPVAPRTASSRRARSATPMTVRKDAPPTSPAATKDTTTTRMKPPREANDIRPSIPVNQPTIPAPAPAPTPTKKPTS